MSALKSIKIRQAETSDTAELARLMVDLGYPTMPEQMKLRLEKISRDTGYQTFVAEQENKLVGMIGVLKMVSVTYW